MYKIYKKGGGGRKGGMGLCMFGSDQCQGKYRPTDRESHDQITTNVQKSFDGADGNHCHRCEEIYVAWKLCTGNGGKCEGQFRELGSFPD